MKDLVTLMQSYRNNLGLVPDYAWFRQGEDSAQVDGGDFGDIAQSTYHNPTIPNFNPNLKLQHKMALKEKLEETMYK